jgi:arylsulfatase A-like enzyme
MAIVQRILFAALALGCGVEPAEPSGLTASVLDPVPAAFSDREPQEPTEPTEPAPEWREATQAEGSGGGPTPPSPPAKPPNIILILADDLTWTLLPYMPEVKRLQADGVTFENYFVSNSLCCPSRATLFTGLHPHSSGVWANIGPEGGLAAWQTGDHEDATFATALQASGYHTALLGKWINGYEPTKNRPQRGWSDWHVAGYAYGAYNYDLSRNGEVVHYGTEPEDYITDVLAGIAGEIVSTARTPFFVQLSTFAPHKPYIAAKRHAAVHADTVYPRTAAFGVRASATDPAWLRAVPPLTDGNITAIDTAFRQRVRAVQAIDEAIGALRAQIEELGIAENTCIVFTSDNGYHMGERSLLPGKRTPYDTDVHVPLIVVGPGVAAGSTVQAITQNVDLCPTFTELGGAETLPGDGRSLVPWLKGNQPTEWRTHALLEHRASAVDQPDDPDAVEGAEAGGPPSYRALRGPDGLYVEYSTGEREWHDSKTDPDQVTNTWHLLPAATQAALAERLRQETQPR